MNSVEAKRLSTSILSRGIAFALIWWLLADGAPASWWIGIPAVLLALLTSVALLPSVTFSWYEMLKFVPFFLLHSLLGGMDVARRALHPAMPIAPGIIDYPVHLPPGLPRVFMANTVNLLPGTLSVELGEHHLSIHVIDRHADFLSELEAVERRVARLFRMAVPDPTTKVI